MYFIFSYIVARLLWRARIVNFWAKLPWWNKVFYLSIYLSIVSFAAVFGMSRNAPPPYLGEALRDIPKTAAKETKGPRKRLQHLLQHPFDFVERCWKVVEWCLTVRWTNGFNILFNKTLQVALVISFMLQIFAHMHNIVIDEQRNDTTAGELKRSNIEGCA